MPIRIINVRGLRTREGRSAICYCGRRCQGWAQSPWHNPFKVGDPLPGNPEAKITRDDALRLFKHYLAELDASGKLTDLLLALWKACDHGKKALGCWCADCVVGDGSPEVCHCQTLGQMLLDRFASVEVGHQCPNGSN